MSVFFVLARKTWRFNFVLNGQRYTSKDFPRKKEAVQGEDKLRRELVSPAKQELMPTATGTGFLDLVNSWLDEVKALRSLRYYQECVYMARRWSKLWGHLSAGEVTVDMVTDFVAERNKVSNPCANKEITYLRAMFNFGFGKKLVDSNPANNLKKRSVEERSVFVPSPDVLDKLIAVADGETQVYLWVIRDTLARVNEINQLTWEDVDFHRRTITLYTRKKKNGSRRARTIALTERLYALLLNRFKAREQTSMPWVFWHTWHDNRTGELKQGPYRDRKRIMSTLCRKAGVRYFRFHALRHSGASVMDSINVPLGTIQRILGHERVTTTALYLHQIGGDVEGKAMANFEAATNNGHQLGANLPCPD